LPRVWRFLTEQSLPVGESAAEIREHAVNVEPGAVGDAIECRELPAELLASPFARL
jgi:hypothetical protein